MEPWGLFSRAESSEMAEGISPNLKGCKSDCLLPYSWGHFNLHVIASCWPNTWTAEGSSPKNNAYCILNFAFDVYICFALGQFVLIKIKGPETDRTWFLQPSFSGYPMDYKFILYL